MKLVVTQEKFDVFPTRVGMDRLHTNLRKLERRIPHTRGDGPQLRSTVLDRAEVFPTRVGMDLIATALSLLSECIPHTRGDGP